MTTVASSIVDPLVAGEGISMGFACWGVVVSTFILVLELLYIHRKGRQKHSQDPSSLVVVKVSNLNGSLRSHIHSGSEAVYMGKTVPLVSPFVEGSAASPLAFEIFQKRYLGVYLVCAFTDWMKGPYTIALYNEYGLSMSQIATLFVVGFLSSLFFGTIAGAIGDTIGRLRMCRWFCLLYAASLLTKQSRSVWMLGFGRVLGGVATSLLSTTFESWMVTAHHSHRYDAALLQETFARAAVLNSLMAILAGLVAQVSVCLWGNIAPFMLPVPLLAVTLWLMRSWTENYGERDMSVYRSLARGFAVIRGSVPLQLLGACEALFEASMFIWVFAWTPSLDSTNRSPFGIIFATFMTSMMAGSLAARLRSLRQLTLCAHVIAVVSAIGASLFFSYKPLVFVAFAISEVAVGIYFVCHPTIRAKLVHNDCRSAVLNLFRVPMNVVVFLVLEAELSPRHTLYTLAVLQALSAVFLFTLKKHI